MWYILDKGSEKGPYTAEEICSLVSAHKLSPHISVWKEGMYLWGNPHEIEEFKDSFTKIAKVNNRAGQKIVKVISVPSKTEVKTFKEVKKFKLSKIQASLLLVIIVAVMGYLTYPAACKNFNSLPVCPYVDPEFRNYGVVQSIQGDVYAGSQEIKVGDKVALGAVVTTGIASRVSILFAPETTLSLGSNTKLIINERMFSNSTHQILVYLTYGVLRTLVKKGLSSKNDVKVKTPCITIGVRGTEFVTKFDVESSSALLYTLEGTVAYWVSNSKNPVEAYLSKGFKVSAQGIGPEAKLFKQEGYNMKEVEELLNIKTSPTYVSDMSYSNEYPGPDIRKAADPDKAAASVGSYTCDGKTCYKTPPKSGTSVVQGGK